MNLKEIKHRIKNILIRIKNNIFEPSLFDELVKELKEYQDIPDSRYKFIMLAHIHQRLSNAFAMSRVYGDSSNFKFNDTQLKYHLDKYNEYREKAENFK